MTHQIPNIVLKNPNTFFYSPEDGIELNLVDIRFASVLNKDGIVKVAGKIIQYSKYDIKVIEDGDPAKIFMLENTYQTSRDGGITVNKVNFKGMASKSSIVAYSYTRSCEGSSGSPAQYKIIVYEESFDMADGVLKYWICKHRVRTLKRGFLGFWYNHATRSQTGWADTNYDSTPSIGTLYTYGWAQNPIIQTGYGTYTNINGEERADIDIVSARLSVNLTVGLNPPYNSIELKFSSSTSSSFTFGTGNCSCSIA